MPVIRVSDYVMDILKKYAIPLEDTADSVLTRILKEYEQLKGNHPLDIPKKITRKSKTRFPRNYAKKYVKWIIASLESLGRSAEAQKVLDYIEKAFHHEIIGKELEPLNSGVLRWVKRVNWARYDMVRGGLLRDDVPHGIWELTEKGRNYYKEVNNINDPKSKEISVHDLNPRDTGKLCRMAFLKHLKKEIPDLKVDKVWLFSLMENKQILTLYSKKHESGWFYGVIRSYWEDWSTNKFLTFLLFENSICSYVLLNPDESKKLLSKATPAQDGSKKIHISIPSFGKIHFQEWPEFPLEEKITEMGDILKSKN